MDTVWQTGIDGVPLSRRVKPFSGSFRISLRNDRLASQPVERGKFSFVNELVEKFGGEFVQLKADDSSIVGHRQFPDGNSWQKASMMMRYSNLQHGETDDR